MKKAGRIAALLTAAVFLLAGVPPRRHFLSAASRLGCPENK